MKRYYPYFCIICMLFVSVSAQAVSRARLEYLISEIKSDDEKRTPKAAIRLAEYGPEASPVIPDLLDIIRSQREYPNVYASGVVSYVSTKEPIDKILQFAQDENAFIRSLTISCLIQRNLDRNQSLAIYTKLLNNEEPFVSMAAINALIEMEAGKLCLDKVINLASDDEDLIKSMAVTAIGEIGIANDQVKKVLADNFLHPDKREAIDAALIYQNMYPEEEKGLQLIQESLKDGNWIIRWRAVEAIGDLKKVDSQTIQLSKELMSDKNRQVVIHTCYCMIRHDIETKQAWEILDEALDAEVTEERIVALMVLLKLGPVAKNYQEKLMELLNDKDELIQIIAINALGEIQPSKEQVMPALEMKLNLTDNFLVWNITQRTISKLKQNNYNNHVDPVNPVKK